MVAADLWQTYHMYPELRLRFSIRARASDPNPWPTSEDTVSRYLTFPNPKNSALQCTHIMGAHLTPANRQTILG